MADVPDIKRIRECARRGDYILSWHADQERRNDDLSVDDVETALKTCEMLEEYPEDKRGPSCLVLGFVEDRPVHVVVGTNKAGNLFVITVYVPSLPKWKNPRERSSDAKT